MSLKQEPLKFQLNTALTQKIMRDYRGKGTWRRQKSATRLVEELEAFRKQFGRLDYVYWVDEVWMTQTSRLAEFSELYRRRIAVPFSVMERPECMTEEKVKLMAAAGLHLVAVGLESGDASLRAKLLNRRTSQKQLEQAFLLPKKYGIRVHTFNMLGLPGQDEKSMLETWKFLRRVSPDSAQFTIFFPLKGTKLYEQVIAQGLYDEEQSDALSSYYDSSPLKQIVIDGQRIKQYQRLFQRFATQPGLWPAIQFHLARYSNWFYRLFITNLPWYRTQLATLRRQPWRERMRTLGRRR